MPTEPRQGISTLVAFAGLTPLCEEILRAGLAQRPDIELVCPWTRLPLLGGDGILGAAELLFVELDAEDLPSTLRVLLVAAEPLKIVGLSPNASRATVFSMHQRRTILLGATPQRLWHRGAMPD
jgi:hypothetical protein